MSIDLLIGSIKRIETEISGLERRFLSLLKKENEINKIIAKGKISQTKKKTNDLLNVMKMKSDLQKKIADKRRKLSEIRIKLDIQNQKEAKENILKTQRVQRNYDKKISEIERKVQMDTMKPAGVYKENNELEWDIFISHASEDKETFVEELHDVLVEYGFKVWYDTKSIGWGDSLRKSIDSGLKKSRYGIVVLSRDFIEKGWTQYELDGLFVKEMSSEKIILPIWHNITKSEIEKFSPTLAGRKALNTTLYTPREIAEELKKIFS